MLAYHVHFVAKKFCKEAFTLAKFLVQSLHEIMFVFSRVKCVSLPCYSAHFVAKTYCKEVFTVAKFMTKCCMKLWFCFQE
jgi:hypothetical protein